MDYYACEAELKKMFLAIYHIFVEMSNKKIGISN